MRRIALVFAFTLLLLGIGGCEAGSITYDNGTNTITIVGFNESSPCTFEDIYQADKAGTLTLISRSGVNNTDTDPVDNSYSLRPSDEKIMGGEKHDLWIEITNWNGFVNATIRLIGKDEGSNNQTEDIVVTGDGTYYSNEVWTELTQTQVISVNGSGSFDYTLVQGQWGVVSKQGNNQYYFTCRLQIGDGSTETWLADENKAISFTGDKGYIYVFKYGHLRLGHIVNEEKRTTRNGCYLYNNASEYYYLILCNDGGVIEIYSSLLKAKKGASLTLYGSGHKIWNSVISSYITGQSHIDMYRTTIQSVTHGVRFIPTYANDIIISNAWYAIDLYSISGDKTVKNLKLIDEITSFRTYNFNGNLHAINTICKWTFSWGWNSNGKIYRQYTYNLKVVDEEGNPISGAKVSVYNRSGYLEFEDITDANGQIPEQIVTRGYYDQAHGKTLVDFSPHTLVIEKEGYETYTMQFTPTKAIDWQISLKKAREQETVGEGIIEVKEERKGKSDIGEGLVLGFEFGIALLAIAFFVMKGGGRE